MRPNLMRILSHGDMHDDCAPKAWNDVPRLTGDYDLDATIAHRHNKDLPDRIHLYVKRAIYGKRTGYSGYRGTDD